MILVSNEDLIGRMDHKYHSLIQSVSKSSLTLKDIGANIKRGSFTHKSIKPLMEPYIHTTHLTKIHTYFKFDECTIKHNYSAYAHEGDILMARVGKGCVGRLGRIKKGSILLTDCVYRITVSSEFLDIAWASLSSEAGQRWIMANIHGVCSKVISKCDLENFPLFVIQD